MPFEVINKAIKTMPGVKFINAFGQTEQLYHNSLVPKTIGLKGPRRRRRRNSKDLLLHW